MNPSHLSFGVGVITPRRLFVLAGATPISHGRPRITDETLEPFDIHSVQAGDVVGIGIHAGNALRGYETGTLARSEAVKAHGGDASTANMRGTGGVMIDMPRAEESAPEEVVQPSTPPCGT